MLNSYNKLAKKRNNNLTVNGTSTAVATVTTSFLTHTNGYAHTIKTQCSSGECLCDCKYTECAPKLHLTRAPALVYKYFYKGHNFKSLFLVLTI